MLDDNTCWVNHLLNAWFCSYDNHICFSKCLLSSLSHGDLDFDPRSDLSQGGGDDAEHPMDITMSRVHLASDTCHIYFIHTKVNHLRYTCPLVPFKDGILLDPSLVCILRCERSYTFIMEESKRKRTTTPTKTEA